MLTVTTLEQAMADAVQTKKEIIVWDKAITGLGARVSPKGKASFILQYRFQGSPRKLTMARYGAIGIAQAKELAKKFHADIARGIDPALRKQEHKRGNTMKDLCNQYIKMHLGKKRWKKDDLRFINTRIIPRLGRYKIAQVTFQDIVAFHRDYGAPIQANRCLALLQAMFNLAKEWGMLDRTADNPAMGVKRNPERARDRYITEHEMPVLMNEIQTYPDPYIKGALLICLFTGIRQMSVMSLEWRDIDLQAGTLKERKAKTSNAGEIVTHILSQSSIDVLSSIPVHGTYVFTNGRTVRTQTQMLWRAWKAIKEKAGIVESENDKLWLHDLRRTLGSWLVKNNYSSAIAKRALNHKSDVAARRYQHINDGDTVKKALEDVHQKFLKN